MPIVFAPARAGLETPCLDVTVATTQPSRLVVCTPRRVTLTFVDPHVELPSIRGMVHAAIFPTSFTGSLAAELDVPASFAQTSPLVVGTARWVRLFALDNWLVNSEWPGPDLSVFTPTSACLGTCFLEVPMAAPTHRFIVGTTRPIFFPYGSN